MVIINTVYREAEIFLPRAQDGAALAKRAYGVMGSLQ